jgi:branched-chain amino acid transport system permease protein
VYFPIPGLHPEINLIISLVAGFFASALFGLMVGVPCLRLRGDYLAIATLGFGEIVRIVIINTDYIGGPRGFTGIPKWVGIHHVYLWVIVVLLILRNLKYSTHGRAIIAIREDEIAAESMGVNLVKYKVIAFVLGAGFAGIAGGLFAHSQQFLHPNNFNFMWSVVILVMVILGGLGSLTGSIIGALIITILPELLKFFGPDVARFRMIIYPLMLITLMIVRPKGFFGTKELWPLTPPASKLKKELAGGV